jgi:hypothetical protein
MTIEIQGIEFDSAGEAIQHVNASGRDVAIHVGSQYLVVEQAEADRIAKRRVEFCYLIDHEMPDGTWRIMTIPVND